MRMTTTMHRSTQGSDLPRNVFSWSCQCDHQHCWGSREVYWHTGRELPICKCCWQVDGIILFRSFHLSVRPSAGGPLQFEPCSDHGFSFFLKKFIIWGGQALGACKASTDNFGHRSRPNNNKVGLRRKQHLFKVVDEGINTELSSTDAGSV